MLTAYIEQQNSKIQELEQCVYLYQNIMFMQKALLALKKIEKRIVVMERLRAAAPSRSTHTRGSQCSVSGNSYERLVHSVVSKCKIDGVLFNTQDPSELGGSSAKNDLQCVYNNMPIGIEVKKHITPDWMQCSLIFNNVSNKWEPAYRTCKIPRQSAEIFDNLLNGEAINDNLINGEAINDKAINGNLFNGKIPPFMQRKITHEEWVSIKKNTSDFNDVFIDVADDTIKQLYAAKHCHYIQISSYGLYHLGEDICNFGVPEFLIPQRIRIRTKVHARKNRQGFCSLSVIAACQPKNIKMLRKSPYTLDGDSDKLPPPLRGDF